MGYFACIIGLTVVTAANALTIKVDQAKISGLLLNTQNDPADPMAIGTGTDTILAYANSVPVNPGNLSTSPNTLVPTATSNGRVTGGVNTIAVKSDVPLAGQATGGEYRVRFQLTGSGNPVFVADANSAQFSVLDFIEPASCYLTSGPTPTTPASPNPAVQEFRFKLSSNCNLTGPTPGPSHLVLDAPWRLTTIGSASVTVTLDQDTQDNGNFTPVGTTTRQLAEAVPPFELFLSADPAPISPGVPGTKRPTLLAFGTPPFQSLSTGVGTDTIIGSFRAGISLLSNTKAGPLGAGAVPAVFTSLGNSTLNTIGEGQLSQELTINTVSGVWNGIRPNVLGLTESNQTTSSIMFSGPATATVPKNITLTQTLDPNSTAESIYTPIAYTASLTLTVDPSLGLPNPPSPQSIQLEPLNQEGLLYKAPWFGGAQSANPGQLRIVNDSTNTSTGPVYIALKAPTPSLAPSNGCQVSPGLAPGAEYIFGAAQATTCFGSFRRGDLFIATAAAAGTVIVKNRVLSAGNYVAESAIAPNQFGASVTNLPWFGGSKASTPSVVRVSNTNSVATGAVSLTLTNIIDGPGPKTLICNATKLPSLASIQAQGELVIGTAEANTCFGAFRRGDIRLEVAGNATGVNTRMRVISGSGAAVAEQNVGNLSSDQTANAASGAPVSLIAGWFGGSLATTPSVLRLSNNGTLPTGQLTLTLSNVVGGTEAGPLTCNGTKLLGLYTILPTTELLIDMAASKACFGDFRRGDLNILVAGPAPGLSAKMRVINTSTGIVTEQALGPKCTNVSTITAASCIIAPWFDGPISASKSVLRITNAATTATGPVQISLRNAVDSAQGSNQVCASDKLASLASISGMGELVFDSVAAKTCFGDFRRGDLYVAVAGATTAIYPAMRLVSGGGGMAADQSLESISGAAPTQ